MTGKIRILMIETAAEYQLKRLIIQLMKKEMPAARAVQIMGTITSRIGSFCELQLKALRAATGMSQSRAKSAKSTSPEKPLKIKMIAHKKRGIRTGRLTMSIKPESQRENPKPPGLIKLPRKNWTIAVMLPKSSAHTPPEPLPPETERRRR